MGDGINDAPALKAADVGISVDSAVDIAKESSDIILLETSLLVLEQGVLEGRRVFGNIVKYIKMAASSNFGNMFSVGGGQRVPALPAHAADPGADQQPAVRLLADRHPDRRGGRRLADQAAPVDDRQVSSSWSYNPFHRMTSTGSGVPANRFVTVTAQTASLAQSSSGGAELVPVSNASP